ncbi:calphotin-like [Fundulus heteroclitus]|uniref:calphotin-like n=1 Tax=Fundulus heteroclitus TaxID=8078 RepID=UPI00165C405D|nr:calphotin-like [Fundulus heteroclitus]
MTQPKLNPMPTQSSHGELVLRDAAERFWIQLQENLRTLPTLSPPKKRIEEVKRVRGCLENQMGLLSLLGVSGLFEELEWNIKAALAQLLGKLPPPTPPPTSLSTSPAAFAAAAAAVSSAAAAKDSASALVFAAAPAAPATSAAAVSAAAPDTSPSTAVSTSLPGSSRRRRRTRRHVKSPEAKPDIPAEAAPTAADVTSLSLVSRPGADAAAQESLARAPCLHEDQLWDFFYGDRDDLLPCWSAPDKTRTVYEAGVHTALPAIAEVPTAHATAQACVGVRKSSLPAVSKLPAQPAEESSVPPNDVEVLAAHATAQACVGVRLSVLSINKVSALPESSALPAAESSALPTLAEAPAQLISEVSAAHATGQACVGVFIPAPPSVSELPAPPSVSKLPVPPSVSKLQALPAEASAAPPAAEKKDPPAAEKKDPPAAEKKDPLAAEKKDPPAAEKKDQPEAI